MNYGEYEFARIPFHFTSSLRNVFRVREKHQRPQLGPASLLAISKSRISRKSQTQTSDAIVSVEAI